MHVADQGSRRERNLVAPAEEMPADVQPPISAGEGQHRVVIHARQHLDVVDRWVVRLDRHPDELVKPLRAGHDLPGVGQ